MLAGILVTMARHAEGGGESGVCAHVGLDNADLTIPGLTEGTTLQRPTAVDVDDVVSRGSSAVQPGTIPLRLALDPQDLLERRLNQRERQKQRTAERKTCPCRFTGFLFSQVHFLLEPFA